MFLLKRKKTDNEPVDMNERSAQLGIKHKDLLVLGQLMASRANLREPRHASYYLYFPSRDAAESAAGEARETRYDCTVRDPLAEYPDQWSLLCQRADAVLNPAGVIAADELFEGIAGRFGGDFDGWEAAAEP